MGDWSLLNLNLRMFLTLECSELHGLWEGRRGIGSFDGFSRRSSMSSTNRLFRRDRLEVACGVRGRVLVGLEMICILSIRCSSSSF